MRARAQAGVEAVGPLPRSTAWRNVLGCAFRTAGLLLRRQTHLRRELVGARLRFADGTSSEVFRETTADVVDRDDPCLLFVTFRLRLLRGRWHKLFLWECILNTPLFVGFPGFMSKLWLNVDEKDRYRGLYEWSDPQSAERYARSLWRVLDLVCAPGSIAYSIVPGLRRAEVLDDPTLLAPFDASGAAWWRVVTAL
ncbi:MAG TPA: hypothetical protein VGF51_08745 [Acidimicrobiales bacterium]